MISALQVPYGGLAAQAALRQNQFLSDWRAVKPVNTGTHSARCLLITCTSA